MEDIQPEHPRSESLKIREKLANGLKNGLVSPEGLAAHGRGEAFDYLLGEKTTEPAEEAIEAGAASIVKAEDPVFSVNGNVSALVPDEIGRLSKETQVKIEVNLFHKSKEREKRIATHLENHGVENVLGIEEEHSAKIPEIESEREIVDKRGQKIADSIVVPLEDGDRTEKLVKKGKKVISIDLNPMSRTAQSSQITIVDNLIRTMPLLIEKIKELRDLSSNKIDEIIKGYDNEKNLGKTTDIMLSTLENMSKGEN